MLCVDMLRIVPVAGSRVAKAPYRVIVSIASGVVDGLDDQ